MIFGSSIAAIILICPLHFGQIEMPMLKTRLRSLAQDILFTAAGLSQSALSAANVGTSFLLEQFVFYICNAAQVRRGIWSDARVAVALEPQAFR